MNASDAPVADSNATPRSVLARLAQAPAEADWQRLDGVYRPFVAGWLRRAGVPDADADDLTQDVFGVMVKELPTFRHSERTGAFRCWLRGVLVNRTRWYWRNKQYAPQATADDVLQQLEDPSSGLSGQWDREHDEHVARRILAALEPEFAPATWAAFRRQVFEGASAADTAAELELTVNAVLIAKSRVLRRFRTEVEGLIAADANLL